MLYASFIYLKFFAYLGYIVPVKIFSKDIEKWPLFIGAFKKVSRNHKTRIVQWPTSFYSQISFFVLFFWFSLHGNEDKSVFMTIFLHDIFTQLNILFIWEYKIQTPCIFISCKEALLYFSEFLLSYWNIDIYFRALL